MARSLLIPWTVKVKGRPARHLSEFCHAACSWRRVVRTGCPPIADLVEIVVSAIDRLQAGAGQSVRSLRGHRALGKLEPGFRLQRVFPAIAGHHERAACGAKPVIDC